MKTAVVTGANKGLGLAMVRSLCRRLGPQADVYLTARDVQRGQAALRALQAEGLSPRFFPMDLAAPDSIAALAEHIRKEHGGVDLVVQNGAYAAVPDRPGKEQVRVMIATNNLGTHRVLEAFAPLLRPQARVLVVASGFGTLKSLDPRLHAAFDTDSMEWSDLESLLDGYVRAVEAGEEEKLGWPRWINIPSKVGQVAAVRIFARQLARDPASPPGVLVNAICPGWLVTDSSRPYLKDLPPDIKPKLPDDAVDDALWPAFLPPGSTQPNGQLIQYRAILPWRTNP
jgi:carbonyl reductase 1